MGDLYTNITTANCARMTEIHNVVKCHYTMPCPYCSKRAQKTMLYKAKVTHMPVYCQDEGQSYAGVYVYRTMGDLYSNTT